MLKIYVDTGGNTTQLRPLRDAGQIALFAADVDNGSYSPKRGVQVKSTNEPWKKDNQSWDEDHETWDDEDNASEVYRDLVHLIGRNKDSLHLDTAYRISCHAFLTSDKGDIVKKREEIFALTKIKVFYNDEIEELLALCREYLK